MKRQPAWARETFRAGRPSRALGVGTIGGPAQDPFLGVQWPPRGQGEGKCQPGYQSTAWHPPPCPPVTHSLIQPLSQGII